MVVMSITMCFGIAKNVSATTISEAKQQKSAAESKLKDINSDIEDIESQEEAIEEEAAMVEAELVDLLLTIDIIKKDIKNKEFDIEVARQEYEAALEREKSQKEAMNKRIKFMYEKGEMSYVEILIDSKNFVESLNKASYTEKLYEYDRFLLYQYQQTKEEVNNKRQVLEDELEELEEIKADSLEQQAQLEALINEYSEKIENFKEQLISARSKAKEYQMEIEKQTASIKKLEEAEAKRKAEEARKIAEALAKKKAAEEALKKKEADEAAKKKALEEEKKKQDENDEFRSIEVERDDDSSSGDSDSQNSPDGDSNKNTDSGGSNDNGGGSAEPPKSSGGSSKGQEIANFALQFVGNPYVPGGTSLTNGADCSGFTQAVYSNFGVSLPRTSGSQALVGTGVSYAEAQPGDIIYYGGHVGIYIGNGQIVHASTQSTGIKVSSALYRSIISVRRIV